MEKSCSFLGHRKIDVTEELIKEIDEILQELITDKGVKTFLFGSQSEFDALCHERTTLLQEKYPEIKRIMYRCRSEYAVKKEEKEKLERTCSRLLKKDIKLQDYDGEFISDRVVFAGKASYVERNQEMINASEYCIFFCNPSYEPTGRKGYKTKSGTKLAWAYANQRQRKGKEITIINLYKEK